MVDFATKEVETDLLILGGGMAACGAAVEAAYWAKQKGLRVTMVDKAVVDRSGAVVMGLSAINQYVGLKDGQNTVKDYVATVGSETIHRKIIAFLHNAKRNGDRSRRQHYHH